MVRIDVLDPKYQLSDQYKPDKEKQYKHPIEQDGWVIAHNALRGEIQLLRDALYAMKQRDQSLQAWEVASLQSAIDGHILHILGHHSNEDDIVVPECRKRFLYPEKLETDHEILVKKIETIKGIMLGLDVGSKVDNLLHEWIEYQDMMLPHLLEEEEVGLPLFRSYFEPKAAAKITQKIARQASRLEMGSFVYFLGTEKFRSMFMKNEGIPDFVWFIMFKRSHKIFVQQFITNVEALTSGTAPTEPKCGSCNIL
jgi:hemerythrin-like domain-containing protein